MALPISCMPVLTGEVAERFVRLAEQAEKEHGTINFSEARMAFRKIVERSKINGVDNPATLVAINEANDCSKTILRNDIKLAIEGEELLNRLHSCIKSLFK